MEVKPLSPVERLTMLERRHTDLEIAVYIALGLLFLIIVFRR
jgi:hypothetical protein